MEEYSEFVKGKRVAVVAHAASIVGTGRGPLIDSYDLVVRLNDSLPIPEELKPDIGTRSDILYTWFSSGTANNIKDSQRTIHNIPLIAKSVSWVCCPHAIGIPQYISDIARINSNHINHELLLRNYNRFLNNKEKLGIDIPTWITDPYKYYKYIGEMNAGMPNTGFAAVWDLLNFDVTEIFMIGHTFFLGGNYKQYIAHPLTEEEVIDSPCIGYETKKHRIFPQLRYLKKLMERDRRIKVDAILAEILATRI